MSDGVLRVLERAISGHGFLTYQEMKDLRKEIDRLRAELGASRRREEGAIRSLSKVMAELAEAKERVEELHRDREHHVDLCIRRGEIVDELERELAEVKRRVVVAEACCPTCKRLRSQLAEAKERVAALESDDYIAHYREANDCLQRELAEAKERIHHLECAIKDEGAVIIMTDQINAAWKRLMERAMAYELEDSLVAMMTRFLADLGIIQCPRCGGTKKTGNLTTEGEWSSECDCPHNGWVMEER